MKHCIASMGLLLATVCTAGQPFNWQIAIESSGAIPIPQQLSVPEGMAWRVLSVSGYGVDDPALASVGNLSAQVGAIGSDNRLWLSPTAAIEDPLLGFIYSYSSAVDVTFLGTIEVRREAFSRGAALLSLHGYLTPSLAGDYTGDGIVDAADYTVIRDEPLYWGSPDIAAFSQNYGKSDSASSSPIPEPGTFLTGILVIGLLNLRRVPRTADIT